MLPAEKLLAAVKRFGRDDGGFITFEWVVLAAAVVILGLGIAFYLMEATDGVGGNIRDAMNSLAPADETSTTQ